PFRRQVSSRVRMAINRSVQLESFFLPLLPRAVKAESIKKSQKTSEKRLTGAWTWCFIVALEDEDHVHNLAVWPASQWADVRLASLHWCRGRELLTKTQISKNPRLPINRGFFVEPMPLKRAALTKGNNMKAN